MHEYALEIVQIAPPQLDAFLDYLQDHLSDNGLDGSVLFQPQSRSDPWLRAHRAPGVLESWAREIGEPGWGRAWMARSALTGQILGHADLRARSERYASHRALLGTGVERSARRRGIATALMNHLLAWAREQPSLAWIDLRVLAANGPAYALYERLGFRHVSTTEDFFRIDGESVADTFMTMKLSSALVSPA
jgi:RimJ/RimL family protein N-acetyltransferase